MTAARVVSVRFMTILSKSPGEDSVQKLSLQSTPNNLNLQGKLKKSSSYREFEANNLKKGNKQMDGEGMQLSNKVYRDGYRIWTGVTKK